MWVLGDVGPGTQHVITYRTIGAEGSGLVTNTAIANSTLADGSPIPNAPNGFRSSGVAHAAALGAGLQIAKLPNYQRVACDRDDGCAVTWQIVVLNADDLDLTDATVVDYLPAGLTYQNSADAAGWDAAVIGASGSGPSSTTPITWTHSGAFASGDVATFEITAHVPPDPDERSYLNHAEASADGVPQVENQALADVYTTASLGNLVWHDADADGRQDPGEPGMAGVTVQLYDDTGTTLLATTATDVNGMYRFTDLEPGSYRLKLLIPEAWSVSPTRIGAPGADSDVGADGWTQLITLASGANDVTWDAGLYQPPPEHNPVPDPDPVPDPGAGGGLPSTPPDPADTGPTGGWLPITGADLMSMLLAATACLAVGLLVLFPDRRRRLLHATGQRRRCGTGIQASRRAVSVRKR